MAVLVTAIHAFLAAGQAAMKTPEARDQARLASEIPAVKELVSRLGIKLE